MYKRDFPTLSACVRYLEDRYPRELLRHSRDIDSGEPKRSPFPRWLFRGEPECYPTSTSGLVRLRASRSPHAAEVERVGDFVHRYVTYQLVLPYLSELETITSLQWLGVAATYEGLAFCQHYGLPTAFIDFTSSLAVSARFATGGRVDASRDRTGRIGVLDVAQSRACSQIWDFRDLSPTRAARQRAYGLYVAREPDLCAASVRQKLGLTWYRFGRNADDERVWRRSFGRLLDTRTDRLAGWLRHAISVHVRESGALSADAAAFFLSRVPLVPLLAQMSERRGYGGFVEPRTIRFDLDEERKRSLRDWTRARKARRGRSTRTYRLLDGSLVRFVGT